jgi:site-specific recombinase XerD
LRAPIGAQACVCVASRQFLLGHVSVQTTERYLGCKQRIREAVNDHIGIEP